MAKFQIGQKVKIIDGAPILIGTIEKVSTWEQSGGIGDFPCYLVYCTEWGKDGDSRWLGETSLRELDGEKQCPTAPA